MSNTDASILDVCVVEDESRLRELLVREIAAMGHDSAGFASAESAWERIRTGTDVVLLDLNLPGMSGIELLEQIRKAGMDVAVVILTGFGGFESAVQSLRWKAEDYLTKPCSLADIDRVLAGVMARKREALRQHAINETTREAPAEQSVGTRKGPAPGAGAHHTVEEIERAHILAVLAAHQDNKRTAAHELGISLRTLYYKLNDYRHQGYIQ